jgi:hypothetical protein
MEFVAPNEMVYLIFTFLWFPGAMQDHDQATATPDRCVLSHPLFRSVSDPLFRRSETDATPSMVVRLGEREALIPLRSLQREFAISDDSPDGRMLGLIAEALGFVHSLRFGDKLPDEVLTGKASWKPDPTHTQIAATRLKLGLVAWLQGGVATGATLDADSLMQVADDPAIRRQVQEAFNRAALELSLEGAQATVTLVEEMAGELAYIEALRQRLQQPAAAFTSKLETLTKLCHGNATSAQTLRQVVRLTKLAVAQINTRFEELDAQTGEVMALLRNVDAQRAFIRSSRDWLYRSQRAWQPILDAWRNIVLQIDPAVVALVNRTYQFLAPRFMPVTEWTLMTRPQRTKVPQERQMAW